jgi:hypothetical protein
VKFQKFWLADFCLSKRYQPTRKLLNTKLIYTGKLAWDARFTASQLSSSSWLLLPRTGSSDHRVNEQKKRMYTSIDLQTSRRAP